MRLFDAEAVAQVVAKLICI